MLDECCKENLAWLSIEAMMLREEARIEDDRRVLGVG